MKDDRKPEEQLIRKLAELRQRIAELEAAVVEHERVKKALQESEETARAFLNSPTDVVALIDTRNIILDVNETTAHRFGKGLDELVGLHCWDLLPPDMAETRRAYADQVIQSGKPVRFEDGRQGTWYDNVFYPILNEQGEVTKVAIWARDITERKRAEETLRRSLEETAHGHRTLLALSQAAQAVQQVRTPQEIYRTICEKIAGLGYEAMVLTLTEDGTHLVVTHMTFEPALLEAAEDLTSLSVQDYRPPLAPNGLLERTVLERRPAFVEQRAHITEALAPAVRPLGDQLAALLGIEQAILAPLTVGDEPYGLLAVTGCGLTEADMPAMIAFANHMAIALENAGLFAATRAWAAELERHVQERTAELAASEAHYRTLFESNRDGLFIINMRGRYIDVNPAACRLLGYSREELLALDIFQVGVQGRGISYEQRVQLLEHFQGIWRQGMVKHEAELISKSGELISVEASIAPLTHRGQEAVLAAVRDVTARKQMEEALRESEEKSRAQYKGIPVPTYTWQRVGEDLVLVDYNDAATVITQGKIADLVGTKASELYRDAPEIREEMRRCVVEETSLAREMPYQLKTTGEAKYWAVKCAFVPPDLVLVHTEDITERKQMEEALRESEEKLRAQYKGIPVPTYTWQRVGEDLVLVDYNDAATVITQGKIADLVGIRATELHRDMPEIREELRRCVVEKTSFAREMLYQFRTTGESKHFAVRYAFVPPDLVLVHTEDITEHKRAEEELRRSQEETLRSHRLLLALSQATQAMQRAHTRAEVYQAIGDEIVKLGYHTIVFTLTDDRKHLTIFHTSLEPTPLQAAEELAGILAPHVRIPLTPDSSFWPVITEGKCTFRERIAGHTAKGASKPGRSLIERLTAMLGVEKAIYAPLKISGETRSVLVVAGTDLTEADVPAVTTFANHAAIALENAHLLEQLNVSQKRLRQLALQITSAQEKERQRLSHALHDEASQALTALKISLQLVLDDLPAEPASLRQRLDDAVSLTDATMEGIRSLAQGLRPPALDAVGLNPTLEGFCRDFARRTQLSIDYLGAELPTLPEAFSICFYRFLQGALANVAKHACASQVAVVLRCSTDKTITLSVEDDGQGFDREAMLSDLSWSRGIGLLGLQERFGSLGGWIEIETQPGQGTRLVGHMPLQKAHDDDNDYYEERQ